MKAGQLRTLTDVDDADVPGPLVAAAAAQTHSDRGNRCGTADLLTQCGQVDRFHALTVAAHGIQLKGDQQI